MNPVSPIPPIGNSILKKVIKKPSTLLGIAPISEHVIRAFLKAASKQRSPALFVVSLNQIDIDGGYTGFTPSAFVEYIHNFMVSQGIYTHVLLQLDHCGPWLKDEHVIKNYSYNEAIEAVIKSVEAFIKAGFNIIHVDTTLDINSKNGFANIETAAERTIQLISIIDNIAESMGREVRYEIGSDRWGYKQPELIDEFISRIKSGLRGKSIDHHKIIFIVADVGTKVKPGNRVDERNLVQFIDIALRHGYYLKIHSGDYLENIEILPRNNVGGVNIGPMFADVQYRVVKEAILKTGNHDLLNKLHELIVFSDRLGKYTKKRELEEYELGLASRYIWNSKEAIRLLSIIEEMNIPISKKIQSVFELLIEDLIDKLNLQNTL